MNNKLTVKNKIFTGKMISRLTAIMLAVLTLCACSGCQSTGQSASQNEIASASKKIFAMDTYITITCYGNECEEAVQAAVDEVTRLDNLLSVGKSDSEISKLNEAGEAVLSEDCTTLVERSLEVYENTDGAFDITIYPLMELWGFTDKNFRVPSESEIESILEHVGSDKLSYENGTLVLGDCLGIDLGAIAKGYTSDRLMEIFSQYDIVSGKVWLGGNVQLYKTKTDGSLWKCGIRDPNGDSSSLLGKIKASDCAVITSGAYERCFTADDGTTYHHILDPSTGWPSESGLKSVTIICREGIIADALSTACYVMGLDKATAFWKSGKYDFDMILMTDDNTIYITSGIKDLFTANNYTVKVIE